MKSIILNYAILFFLSIVFSSFSGFSQVEYSVYEFSGEFENSHQNARAAFPSPEGGYLVFGNTGSGFYSDTSKVFVLKIDESGVVEWTNVIGLDTKMNYLNNVVKTPSNTFMAVGHHKEEVSFSEPVHQLIAQFDETGTANWLMHHNWEWDDELQGIIRTDENLDIIWTKRIDASGYDYPFSIEKTSDSQVKKMTIVK